PRKIAGRGKEVWRGRGPPAPGCRQSRGSNLADDGLRAGDIDTARGLHGRSPDAILFDEIKTVGIGTPLQEWGGQIVGFIVVSPRPSGSTAAKQGVDGALARGSRLNDDESTLPDIRDETKTRKFPFPSRFVLEVGVFPGGRSVHMLF